MGESKEFPEGMEPIGGGKFQFLCHPDVPCFTVCCNKVDLLLYPYDIIRLKTSLGISSEEFMHKYTRLVKGDNPYFPSVMLKLTEEGAGSCPFLSEAGCSVYDHRPTSCRTYPLERAVDRNPANKGREKDYYFLARHDYCKGHNEKHHFTVRQWIRNQRLDDFNSFNDLWAEIDTLFRSNPWQGEGAGGPRQQLAFMVCYNIDGFRQFIQERRVLEEFRLPKDRKRRIQQNDEELLKFGFDWLKHIFSGKSSLIRR